MPELNNNADPTKVGVDDAGKSVSKGTESKPILSPLAKSMESSANSVSESTEVDKQKTEADKVKAGVDAKVAEEAKKTAEVDKGTPATDFEKQAKEFQSRYDKAKAELDEYEKDPLGTVKKKHPQVFENLEAASDLDGFIGKWQKTTLMEELKKKFPDMGESWQFDASETYTAGTASYQFRVATEEKRVQLVNSLKSQRDQEQTVVARYAEQRDKDLSFIKETYGFDDEQIKTHLTQFDSIHKDVIEGKQPAEKHPFAIRNLMRGMFFDELVKIHVDKAIKTNTIEVIAKYREKGFVLPELQPTDITKVGSESTTPQPPKKPSSPFQQQMDRALA